MRKLLVCACALCLVCGIASAQTQIEFAEGEVRAGAGVETDGATAVIRQGGAFRVSGTSSQSRLIVDTAEAVELVWDGATLSNSQHAPLTALGEGELTITLPEGGGGALSDLRAASGIEQSDAALVCEGKLIVRGGGTLAVSSAEGDGVLSGEMRMEGGTLAISAGARGVCAQRDLTLHGGVLQAEAGFAGAEVGGDARVLGGDLRLSAGADGLVVGGEMLVEGGALEISAGGGASAAVDAGSLYGAFSDFFPFFSDDFFFGGRSYESYEGSAAVSAARAEVSGGSLVLDASGDALYASDELLIEGGAISISCGGNGLRTDGDAQLLGGSVWIDESDVGLAGKRVTVENALINVTSGAEGILAQAGDEAADGVRIGEGAALTIDAGACGIATDARLLFEGGETVIRCAQRSYAPTSAQGGAYATGGTLIATGMSGDGADVAGDAAQPTLLARFSGTVGSGAQVVVEDEAGEAVISFTAQERFCVFQASCPQLRAGERYTLYLDGEAVGAVTVEGALNLFAPQDAPDAAPQPAPDVQPEQADEQDGTARI